MRWPSGDSYVGVVKEFKKEGKGLFRKAGEYTYNGEYMNDKEHGFGKWTQENGSFFIGRWRNGTRIGDFISVDIHKGKHKFIRY